MVWSRAQGSEKCFFSGGPVITERLYIEVKQDFFIKKKEKRKKKMISAGFEEERILAPQFSTVVKTYGRISRPLRMNLGKTTTN